MSLPKSTRRPSRKLIENHPERHLIEMAKAGGVSYDKIAERFGVDRYALLRHWRDLPADYKAGLVADVPREELIKRAIEESGSLLDHFKLARNMVEQQLIIAKACGDNNAVANLGRAAVKVNEAIGKLTGEIRAIPGLVINNNNQQINILETPAFRTLETGLLEIAERHPAAKSDIRALVRRLQDAPQPAPLVLEANHA